MLPTSPASPPPTDPGLGDLALDFLHTHRAVRGGWVDDLQAPATLVGWLTAHLPGESLPAMGSLETSDLRVLVDEARRLRADVRALVEAHHRRRPAPDWALFGVNRVLSAVPWSWRLGGDAGGLRLDPVPSAARPVFALGPVALAAARLVATAPPGRLRPCASPRCRAWFLDTSKGGRRRWCSMARCGNREKAAVHRAKVALG